MPVLIKVDSTDAVITSLFDMQHKETLHSYRKGIRSQINSEQGLRLIQDLVLFLQYASRTNLFERREPADLYRLVGYQFGFIHGSILTPQRALRSDVTTLVAFEDNQDAMRGYKAGRHFFFYEATPDERTINDDQLVERFRELTKEAPAWHDPERVWFFTVGCLLGELSGHLFPQTGRERQQWQEEEEGFMKEHHAVHHQGLDG